MVFTCKIVSLLSFSGGSIRPIRHAAPPFTPVSSAFFPAAPICPSATQAFQIAFLADIGPFSSMPMSASAFYPANSAFPDAIIIPKSFPFFLQLSLPLLCPLLLSLQLLLLIPLSQLFIRSQVFLIFDHCFAAGLDSPVSSLVPCVSSASFSSFLPHLVLSLFLLLLIFCLLLRL